MIQVLIPDVWGTQFASQVLTLNCNGLTFETGPSLPFNFTSGACSTNDNYIMFCFSRQNRRRCHKSTSPMPVHWWQLTLTRMSKLEHKSTTISLSSYNTSGTFIIANSDLRVILAIIIPKNSRITLTVINNPDPLDFEKIFQNLKH